MVFRPSSQNVLRLWHNISWCMGLQYPKLGCIYITNHAPHKPCWGYDMIHVQKHNFYSQIVVAYLWHPPKLESLEANAGIKPSWNAISATLKCHEKSQEPLGPKVQNHLPMCYVRNPKENQTCRCLELLIFKPSPSLSPPLSSSPLPLASGRAGDVGDGMSVGTRIPSSRGVLRPGCFVFPWY